MKNDNTYKMNSTYACATAGGGVMYIPEAIERVSHNIHKSELKMTDSITYNDLVGRNTQHTETTVAPRSRENGRIAAQN
jgi:hypothetical protein